LHEPGAAVATWRAEGVIAEAVAKVRGPILLNPWYPYEEWMEVTPKDIACILKNLPEELGRKHQYPGLLRDLLRAWRFPPAPAWTKLSVIREGRYEGPFTPAEFAQKFMKD
jgi:hypothetical protein